MNLSPHSIEALKHKADVAADSYDPTDPETACWKHIEAACREVATAGTVEALKASIEAQEELDNYTYTDMRESERNAIVIDLCRAGYHDRYDPDTYRTRRPRTKVVDGVRYIVG